MCTPSEEWWKYPLVAVVWPLHCLKRAPRLSGAQSVAGRIREYQESAVETIIASADPQLEEAFYVAELLFARLGLQGEPLKERGWDLEFGRGRGGRQSSGILAASTCRRPSKNPCCGPQLEVPVLVFLVPASGRKGILRRSCRKADRIAFAFQPFSNCRQRRSRPPRRLSRYEAAPAV